VQLVGISTDGPATLKRFKEETKAPYPMLSDPGGKVAAQYAGLLPVVGMSKRASFVVARDGHVKEIIEGGDAIEPGQALAACGG
jgi:peroxiredoxin